jgi:hypothetical protein
MGTSAVGQGVRLSTVKYAVATRCNPCYDLGRLGRPGTSLGWWAGF